jgi:hypothetical protein
MSERHRQQMPDWARRERAGDMAWIKENVHVFWPAAQRGYAEVGRGALVVDTTSQPVKGAGHLFGYLPQEAIEQQDDENTQRMVREYDPSAEFVTVLLKTKDRMSSYRVRLAPREHGMKRV